MPTGLLTDFTGSLVEAIRTSFHCWYLHASMRNVQLLLTLKPVYKGQPNGSPKLAFLFR